MILMNNPKPTIVHDVELSYIPSNKESGVDDF